MTRQQADKILKAFTDISACDGNGESVSVIMHELKDAVRKQVPRKIKHTAYTDDPFSPNEEYWDCPGCNNTLFISPGEIMPFTDIDYCPWCGQRVEL